MDSTDIWAKMRPVVETVQILVGHKYLAKEIVDKLRGGYPVSMPDIAIEVAIQMMEEQDEPVNASADTHAQYTEDGYLITFAWIEWLLDTEV